jgi:hypothetical protein
MRTVRDFIGKGILQNVLDPAGKVDVHHEIPPGETQWADVCFEPDPSKWSALDKLGLIGRMSQGPRIFELFGDMPNRAKVEACLSKLDRLRDKRRLEARKARQNGPSESTILWVIAPGLSEEMARVYHLIARKDWPPGFYEGPEGFGLCWVSLRELPKTRETVLLRLMGTWAMPRDAIGELAALPKYAWENLMARDLLLARQREIEQSATEEPDMRLKIQGIYEKWERETMEKGRLEGELRGRRDALRTAYQTRFGKLPDGLALVIDSADQPETLGRWLKTFLLGSPDEIARTVAAEANGKPGVKTSPPPSFSR